MLSRWRILPRTKNRKKKKEKRKRRKKDRKIEKVEKRMEQCFPIFFWIITTFKSLKNVSEERHFYHNNTILKYSFL